MRQQRKDELVKVLERVDRLLEQPKLISDVSMRLIWELQEDIKVFMRELKT